MSRWCGLIGFSNMKETDPGIWENQPIEKKYYGDMYRNSKLLSNNDINDNINISSNISIVADSYAHHNILNMLYVKLLGSKWKITNAEVQYPRIILTIGGLYNEE